MLKYYREKRKYTQQRLANEIGVAERTIQRIEKTNKTDVETAIKIAKTLNFTVEEIFEKKEENKMHCEK